MKILTEKAELNSKYGRISTRQSESVSSKENTNEQNKEPITEE